MPQGSVADDRESNRWRRMYAHRSVRGRYHLGGASIGSPSLRKPALRSCWPPGKRRHIFATKPAILWCSRCVTWRGVMWSSLRRPENPPKATDTDPEQPGTAPAAPSRDRIHDARPQSGRSAWGRAPLRPRTRTRAQLDHRSRRTGWSPADEAVDPRGSQWAHALPGRRQLRSGDRRRRIRDL